MQRRRAHVLVEKPIGISTAECAELGLVAEAEGRAAGVNCGMVYQPVVQRLIGWMFTFGKRFVVVDGRLGPRALVDGPPEEVRQTGARGNGSRS